jgi:hypothetical protein
MRVTNVEKLSIDGKEIGVGAFVKNLRGATGTGFADGFHVHKDWMATTISFDQALDIVDKAESERKDYTLGTDEFKFGVTPEGRFGVEIDGRWYRPTPHSFAQMSTKIGVKSSSILREMDENADQEDSATMARIASNAVRHTKTDAKYFIRTYADGTLRAWFSDRYAAVDNRWVLETMKEFLPSARLSHWKSDEDTLWGNLLLPDSMKQVDDGNDTDFGCMLSLGNCEIGFRKLYTLPSLFRSICLNGCIWGAVKGSEISRKHIGTIDLSDLKIKIANSIKLQLPILSTAIDDFLATRSLVATAPMESIFAAIAAENKLSEKEIGLAFKAFDLLESQNENLYGVVNSITRAGQGLDSQRWYEFDVLGGKLANMGRNSWDRLNSIASRMDGKQVATAFGIAV